MELYGYHPPYITSPLKGKSKVQAMEYHIDHQQEVIHLLKDNLTILVNWMRQTEYEHWSEMSFDEGDHILLRL